MLRYSIIALLTAIIGILSQSHAQADRIHVKHNQQTLVSTVTVKAAKGRVAWADVARGISRAQGYDDDAVRNAMPRCSLNLNGW